MPKKKNNDGLRAAIRKFRSDRETAKELESGAKKQQPLLINQLRELGVDNDRGLIWDEDDNEKGTAYVQQNAGTDVWDNEKIIDWLSDPKRKSLKRKASSTVFDINKFEALVASGEVPAKVAAKFRYTTEPPAPFIRFGKRKDNSL